MEKDLTLDERMMDEALAEAEQAQGIGEVPIGAVVACDGQVVGRGHNRREIEHDPTLHAEIIALRDAARRLGRWRLSGCTVYCTVEPCMMCAGAMHLARIDRVVYGVPDPKAGAVDTLYEVARDRRLNHQFEVRAGVRAEQSRTLLQEFFASLRERGSEEAKEVPD
ncbi:MAG: nucleoside deaminase [Actinobacteria bacterium]|nr:MAG: nucleoside deaminase [Actinomycetota bacterium]